MLREKVLLRIFLGCCLASFATQHFLHLFYVENHGDDRSLFGGIHYGEAVEWIRWSIPFSDNDGKSVQPDGDEPVLH